MTEFRGIFYAIGLFVLVFVVFSLFGYNSLGERTVIVYPGGSYSVVFEPGLYWEAFGHTESYNDVLTLSYEKTGTHNEQMPGIKDPKNPTVVPEPITFVVDTGGIPVRYSEGGEGTIFGVTRFSLPANEESMITLHKAFRSEEGLRTKLLQPSVKEAINLTAALMTSEEAYSEKRAMFSDVSRDQLEKGKYQTVVTEVEDVEEVPELDTKDGAGKTTVVTKRTKRRVSTIKNGPDGLPIHQRSDLSPFGITISSHQITNWGFEPKTLYQIAAKRQAMMAIMTAKAEAERSKQDAITAEQQGLADVMKAKYAEEQEKIRAVVQAEKEKETAEIGAQKLVAVARAGRDEAAAKAQAAEEYKKERMLKGQGDAAYKQAVMNADGALAQKLEAYIQVNARYAEALAAHPLTPQIVMGGGDNSSPPQLVDLMKAKYAKDLSLDLSLGK